MIARIWRGAVRAQDAQAYAAYVQRTGIEGYQSTPGNRGAWLLWRTEGDRAEFITVSFWESRAAIEAFAGDLEPECLPQVHGRRVGLHDRVELDVQLSHCDYQGRPARRDRQGVGRPST